VLSSVDNIEIRQYAPMIIAEVEVQGKLKEAIGNGFRLLADYIFGNNTVEGEIAMTAPVQQQANEKIAMTAPVQQQSSSNLWKVSFVIPAEYRLETLPKPNNKSVKLNQLPAKRFIAIQFSGRNSGSTIAKYEKQLVQYIEKNQIQTLSSPKYAFYNPPWTLPFLRRNEVMLEINEGE
jgi:effector-binding domain-containing protein